MGPNFTAGGGNEHDRLPPANSTGALEAWGSSEKKGKEARHNRTTEKREAAAGC